MAEAFFAEGSRLLTPAAFAFVLDNEMKRAARSQNFFTLLVLDAKRVFKDMMVTADDGTLSDVAQVVGPLVRETDALARTDTGMLSLLLLDADFDNSVRVVDRLVSHFERYELPTAVHVAIGAACFPTHATDVSTLKRQAALNLILSGRSGMSLPKKAQSDN